MSDVCRSESGLAPFDAAAALDLTQKIPFARKIDRRIMLSVRSQILPPQSIIVSCGRTKNVFTDVPRWRNPAIVRSGRETTQGLRNSGDGRTAMHPTSGLIARSAMLYPRKKRRDEAGGVPAPREGSVNVLRYSGPSPP